MYIYGSLKNMIDDSCLNNTLSKMGNFTIQLCEIDRDSAGWYPIATDVLCSDRVNCYLYINNYLMI